MDLELASGKKGERLEPPLPRGPSKWVRAYSREWPYVIDVEIMRTPDRRDVATAVTIWRQFGLEPAGDLEGTEADPLTPAIEPVSPRDIKRLPLSTLLKTAVAYGTWDLHEVKRLTLPRGKTHLTYPQHKTVADAYKELERRGERPVPEIARRMGVPPNRVHQWVRRYRYELKDENGQPLLPPPPPRKQSKGKKRA